MDAQHVSKEVRDAVDAAMQDLVLLGEHMRDSAGPNALSIAQKLLRIKFLADEIGVIEVNRPDYVIEIESVNGPCWVASGGGDQERTHDIKRAEVYATEVEANENMNAFRKKYPKRKFTVRTKPEVV